ncbi:hypothetical protein PanWU01x14_030880, partial [Parasponia andersonii]
MGWVSFASITEFTYLRLVRGFYATLKPKRDVHGITYTIRGKEIDMNISDLCEILEIQNE